MLELEDTDFFSGTITNTGTESLTVETRTAEFFELMLDDTADGAPPSYDVKVEFFSTAAGDFMTHEKATASTAFSPPVNHDARGQKVKITITNTSGADASYRISLESFKQV